MGLTVLMWRGIGSGVAVAPLLLFAGCEAPLARPNVENIQCVYTFHGVDQRGERERIYHLAASAAKPGTLQPPEVPATADFQLTFVTSRLPSLDQIHGPMLFSKPSANGLPSEQVFNAHNPSFSITYDTVTLGAKIEMIVNFRVTPGARLFYKAQGDGEKDITGLVGPDGNVQLRTMIHKGQDFIFARTVEENVVRFIRINVFTQEAQEIPRSEYP